MGFEKVSGDTFKSGTGREGRTDWVDLIGKLEWAMLTEGDGDSWRKLVVLSNRNSIPYVRQRWPEYDFVTRAVVDGYAVYARLKQNEEKGN